MPVRYQLHGGGGRGSPVTLGGRGKEGGGAGGMQPAAQFGLMLCLKTKTRARRGFTT